MNKIFFLILVFCSTLANLTAQVRLGPVLVNHAMRNAQNKTGETHPYCLTNPYLWIAKKSEVRPSCGAENGSITIEIFSSSFPVVLTLENQAPIAISSSEYTFSDLAAGAYDIQVTNDDEQSYHTLEALNSDVGAVSAIDNDAFFTYPALCENGRITKTFTICSGINCLYKIFDNDGVQQGTFNQLAGYKDLPIGDYYIEYSFSYNGSSQCKAFKTFKIEQTPINEFPFLEDFNRPQIFPDPNKWADKSAYINYSYAINPPTIGVATLDGLDEYGMPYVYSDVFELRDADLLTSRPFCFDELEEQIDDLYASFFFQPQGYGDYPNELDTLYFEVKDVRHTTDGIQYGRWKTLWKAVLALDTTSALRLIEIFTVAEDTLITNFTPNEPFNFKPVFLNINNSMIENTVDEVVYQSASGQVFTTMPIDWPAEDPITEIVVENPEASYIKDGLLFRFRNKAYATGINDHWHIDYIQLDADNVDVGYDLGEIAHFFPPKDFLINYSAMPWNQFFNYQEKECDTLLNFNIKNNSSQQSQLDLAIEVNELCTPDEIEPFRDLLTTLIEPQQAAEYYYNPDLLLGNLFRDGYFQEDYDAENGVVIRTKFIANTDDDFDVSNNTFIQDQIFSNYFAYDDGSAEKSLQLYGNGVKLATRYVLNEADQLKGISISYNQVVGNLEPGDGMMTLKAWKKIDGINGATSDEEIFSQDISYPGTSNHVDGYSNYYLADYDISPIEVNDTIFIGFEVQADEVVNIGFDRNSDALNNSFIDSSGEWVVASSELVSTTGAPMLRAIIGNSPAVGIDKPSTLAHNLILYPNPTDGLVNFLLPESLQNQFDHFEVIDLAGKQIYSGYDQSNIDLSHIANGFYFIQVFDDTHQLKAIGKLIKN